MMTSSNGHIFRVTGLWCGEFTGHRWIPLTKASDAELWCFFDLRLNKRLSKQSRLWWFETPSRSLWRQCNDAFDFIPNSVCTLVCVYFKSGSDPMLLYMNSYMYVLIYVLMYMHITKFDQHLAFRSHSMGMLTCSKYHCFLWTQFS